MPFNSVSYFNNWNLVLANLNYKNANDNFIFCLDIAFLNCP